MKNTHSPSKNEIPALPEKQIQWFRRQLQTWSIANFRDFPWRRTTDPYAIFIAELLLQKTDATTAEKIYETFLAQYFSPEAIATTNIEEIAQQLAPLGLHFRAKRLHQAAQIILEKYGGKIPATETELLELPGVGKYTARSICTNAFKQPLAVLDTNIARIIERFFGIKGNRVKSRCKVLWGIAEIIAPKTNVDIWNLTLIDFGSASCTASRPRCQNCPLEEQCSYSKINYSDS
ncbi:MAG: A/G-specific adenine glycosylase [Okeania sp. SIO2F4]|uniref:A/G-specific adenine glycosylase n=1 Tax=Okeania sp. SIO2F4 TaxID=2607790 RepID=UPI00142B932A|nr:A/G-specific adenine glycosylase [Okeania sp. SIO2F4]NES04395.1 A/G-specific adenine glycosylase [Okeania sp. SIO2F4]